jgi:hypothetical protein
MNKEIDKIKQLSERLERPYTSALNEAKIPRVYYDFNEFIDMLKSVRGGTRITIGYVSDAKIAPPKVQRINPATGRKKGYPDWSVIRHEGEGEIASAVRVRRYNVNFRNPDSVNNEYSEYKKNVNDILTGKGLQPMKDREDNYKDTVNYGGKGGVEVYTGKNQEHQGEGYIPYNLYGIKPISDDTYAIDVNGHILGKVSPEDLITYASKTYKYVPGLSELKKMNATQEEMDAHVKQIDDLKMFYMVFKWSSLMFVSATVDGEKKLLINQGLKRVVDDVNINPQDFLKLLDNYYMPAITDTID